MASGPSAGEGGAGDGVTEKQRFVEIKVYTRKAFKGLRKNNNNIINNNNNDITNSIVDVATVSSSVIENKEDNDDIRNKETSTAPTITTPTPTPTTTTNNDDTNVKSDINLDNGDNLPQPLPCTAVTEDENPTQQQLISRLDAASDDSSCHNHPQVAAGDAVQSTQDILFGNGVVEKAVENHNNNSLASRSKQVVQELRHKLEGELEMIRNLLKKIEAKQGELSESSNFHGSANEGMDKVGEDNQIHSEVAAVSVPRVASRPPNQLSIPVLENSQGVSDYVEKEKRTPKANPLYRNSEFLLGKDRLPPAESNKKAKMITKKLGAGEIAHGFGLGSKLFKSCSSLLDRLIKHKYGWVFDAPVDVEGLGLHDYHTIIKHPMDLGTVKSRLNKNWYKSPREFAEDVRLTFRNAMTYNPPGQDVHAMADQLLTVFEDRWVVIESDYNREMRFGLDYGASLSTPTSRKARLCPPPPLDMRRILERSESTTYRLDSKNKPSRSTPSARTPAPKKPKAKDPHKRDMTYEEKQKLSSNLQNLPSEKLDAILQIIKKRNSSILQEDEEIEVDIDSVDAETLWELDRFVTNYRKSLSKKKRKAELALQARADGGHNISQKIQAPVGMEVGNETKTDQNNVSSSVPVQEQGNSRSRSSSSNSSSSDSGSSSSDSDSESSSASGSDSGS